MNDINPNPGHNNIFIFAQLRIGDKVYRIRTIDDSQQLEGPHEILKIEQDDHNHPTLRLQDLTTKKLHSVGAQLCILAEWINTKNDKNDKKQ